MPIRGFEDVPGDMFKALEEAGHGRRIVIADRSLDPERGAEVVHYRGQTSAQALKTTLRLVPREGLITLMMPDPEDKEDMHKKALAAFVSALGELGIANADAEHQEYNVAFRLDPEASKDGWMYSKTGFYTMLKNPHERRLYIRTPDSLPYACASFVVGHSQFGAETSQPVTNA